MPLGLANASLAQGHELLAFGEGPHSHGPFFKSNRHIWGWGNEEIYGAIKILRAHTEVESQQQENSIVRELFEILKCCCKITGISAKSGFP